METLIGSIGLISFIVGFIALIVFFMMSANIGRLKKLAETQVKQNDYIIEILKINTPSDKLKEVDDAEKQRKSKMWDGKDTTEVKSPEEILRRKKWLEGK